MRLFHERQDETINNYILFSEVVFFLLAGIFVLRSSGFTYHNFFSKSPLILILLSLICLLILSQKIKFKWFMLSWILEFVICIIYLVIVTHTLKYEFQYLFKLTLIMPVIIISLRYGLKVAFFAAALSISATLYLSYLHNFATIDADIIYSEIIILFAWLLGQMTDTQYKIRLNLQLEIQARKKAEIDLQNQLCFLQNLIDTIPNPIYYSNFNYFFIGCNQAFVDAFDISKDDLTNKSIWDIFPLDVARKIISYDEKPTENLSSVLELTLTNLKGVAREIILNKAPFYDNEGRILGSLGMITDITDQKQFQKDMARVDRMNLVGQMAASIAHEIRNPITTVRGFLQLFQIQKDIGTLQGNVDLMVEELDRANNIITDYLSLAKSRVLDLSPKNLNNIILSLAPLLESDATMADKDLDLRLGDIPNALFDETQIRQMLLNLCRNGLEAMNAGGILTISTYLQEEDIVLKVKDQGKGIGPEIADKIGTPFVTNKEHGTGLGLAVCYSIAARHNGVITFDSSPKGTSFYIRFKTY